jgi:RHS repeat-associated protein
MKDSLDRIDFATRRKGGVDSRIVIVCEYSKSGQIVARTANGVRQTYEYDKKGQLLAVKDDAGNAVESYAYDKAGNMLRKQILRSGRARSPSAPQSADYTTTTFAFDAANQLVSSTADGVTTRYAYDAAGRLVREGSKTYRYGYLDKVMSVTDNGSTYTYDYHADGQLASANYGDSSESFAWDGLALIQRGDEQFINEPHVGGGNPVASSKGTSYFNDALGTTVGSKSNGKYSAAVLSAFGEGTDADKAFFTGKPMVEGLGHAFLMRNYRAGLAKWQSADPMGYPDGWNQLAYCNNAATGAVDLWGCATVTSTIVVSGTPSNPAYGGETSWGFIITDLNAVTHTISVQVVVKISFALNLRNSCLFSDGVVARYYPHKGYKDGTIEIDCTNAQQNDSAYGLREAAYEHEYGHANYVINEELPRLELQLHLLELRWEANPSWSEAQVRDEVVAIRVAEQINSSTKFYEAANDPTINWFNSSPEWKLLHTDHRVGYWEWVKE